MVKLYLQIDELAHWVSWKSFRSPQSATGVGIFAAAHIFMDRSPPPMKLDLKLFQLYVLTWPRKFDAQNLHLVLMGGAPFERRVDLQGCLQLANLAGRKPSSFAVHVSWDIPVIGDFFRRHFPRITKKSVIRAKDQGGYFAIFQAIVTHPVSKVGHSN